MFTSIHLSHFTLYFLLLFLVSFFPELSSFLDYLGNGSPLSPGLSLQSYLHSRIPLYRFISFYFTTSPSWSYLYSGVSSKVFVASFLLLPSSPFLFISCSSWLRLVLSGLMWPCPLRPLRMRCNWPTLLFEVRGKHQPLLLTQEGSHVGMISQKMPGVLHPQKQD